VIVNTVIANPGQRAIHSSTSQDTTGVPKAMLSVVGNVVLLGRESKKSAAVFEGDANGYFKENEGYGWDGTPLPVLRVPFATAEKPPLWPEGLKATSTTAALWHVARSVGARPGDRDDVDQRIITDALTGHAKIIDSQDQVGGYPKIKPVIRALDVPATQRREWLDKVAQEVE